MDENTKEYTLDDLEDIIREYSANPPKPAAASDATVRLSDTRPVGRSPASPAPDDDDVRIYPPRGKKQQTVAVPPYSPAWEEPSAPDFPAHEPIPFPKNRAQALRQKLADGPQQQYQRLDRAAPARMRAVLLLNLLLFLGSAATSLLYHRTDASRLKFMVLGQILVMLFCALLGYRRLLNGVSEMLHGRFRMDSLLAVTLAVCWIDGLICLKSHNLPFSAVFSLQMLMAQWAQYQKLQIRISQLDTLRKAPDLTAVVKTDAYYRHQPAYQTREGEPEEFADAYRETSRPEKILCTYALCVVVLGVILGVITAFVYDAATAVRVCASVLLAAAPATVFTCLHSPMATLERRMRKLGIVLCGWSGVQNVEKHGFYPLTHKDLFPDDHVKLNGVRFYGERNPNTIVSYVSALMKADGGSLAAPFEQLRASRNARVCKVEELTSYPGGVGGQIDGLSVIAGTLEFIENMGVELSEVSRIPHAVYAAVNQSLCAVFAVNFSASKSSAAGLRSLCDSRRVRPILVDCDFAMTDSFLEQKLGADTRRMQFPDCATRMTLAEKRPTSDAPVIALATRPGLAQRACAVTGAAALRSAWTAGLAVHLLGGILGILAVILLALSGAAELLTPYNLLLYGCVWMIPGLLVTEWTRAI